MARRSKATVFADNDDFLLSERSTTRNNRRTGGITNRQIISLTWHDRTTFAPNFDAVSLLVAVADPVMEAISENIKDGKEGDGSPQLPLDAKGEQGVRAAKGERPKPRGWNGRSDGRGFPDAIERTKIVASGTVKSIGNKRMGVQASCKIRPGPRHRGFVIREAQNGIEYFKVPRDVVKRAVKAAVRAAMTGKTNSDTDEKQAKDV